jgi:threonine/homoserine/homoserine lactone efflux protein
LVVYLILGITFGFAAAIQPGPFQTFLISRTLQQGWRHTLPAAFAPLLSDLPVVALALLILTRLPVWIENFLHLAGGLFVIYLAWGAYRSFKTYNSQQTVPTQSRSQNFFKAVFVNLLNPNPYLEWSLVMGPLLLKGWREAHASGIALIVGFYAAVVITCSAIILMFAGIGKAVPKINRILIGISAAALLCFGVYQLWLGANGIWIK